MIENIEFKHNVLFSTKSDQLIAKLLNAENDNSPIDGTLDSNHYIHPIDSNDIIREQLKLPGSWLVEYHNISDWTSKYGFDPHSNNSPVMIPTPTSDDIFFDYNYSNTPKTVYLPGTYIDEDSIVYPGQYILQPYRGVALLRVSPFIAGCTDSSAHNYNFLATLDDGSCQTCSDGVQNGDETGVDCGGTMCTPCNITAVMSTFPEKPVQIYPNPSNSNFTIVVDKASDYTIRNLQGQSVLAGRLNMGDNLLETNLPAGIILLEINAKIYKLVIK